MLSVHVDSFYSVLAAAAYGWPLFGWIAKCLPTHTSRACACGALGEARSSAHRAHAIEPQSLACWRRCLMDDCANLCLPACVDPKKGFHHWRCPNFEHAAVVAEALANEPPPEERMPLHSAQPLVGSDQWREKMHQMQEERRRMRAAINGQAHSSATRRPTDELDGSRAGPGPRAVAARDSRAGTGPLAFLTRHPMIILCFTLSFSIYRSPISVRELYGVVMGDGPGGFTHPPSGSHRKPAIDALDALDASTEAASATPATAAAATAMGGMDEQVTSPAPRVAVPASQPARTGGFWRRAVRALGIGRRRNHQKGQPAAAASVHVHAAAQAVGSSASAHLPSAEATAREGSVAGAAAEEAEEEEEEMPGDGRSGQEDADDEGWY